MAVLQLSIILCYDTLKILKSGLDRGPIIERYEEYFVGQGFSQKDFVRLDCVRSAFWYSAKCIKPDRIYIPYLNCNNSTDPFNDLGIPYEYYNLDNNLLPIGISPKSNDAVLWVNYYGNADQKAFSYISNLSKITNVIVDCCHAFWAEPIKGAWNCFSMRKFFGVSDGAYLVKNDIPEMDLVEADSADNIAFLIECIEKGTNACYQKHLINEDRLGKVCMKMSALTRRILKTIDYERIKQIRRENFIFLHNMLKDINEFDVNVQSDTHICYPLLVSKDDIRKRLIDRKIYTPTWWRHVPDYFSKSGCNNIECKYSRYMLLLPIDQRYRCEDMEDMSKIVLEEYSKCR